MLVCQAVASGRTVLGMNSFGLQLRRHRLRAGLGLRTFAGLVEQRASTVSAIESGRRAAWQRQTQLRRVADVLGIAENSDPWAELLSSAARSAAEQDESVPEEFDSSALLWWWTTDDGPPLDTTTVAELAGFLGIGAGSTQETGERDTPDQFDLSSLTELAIEWRVRRLLGRRDVQVAAASVDVEAVLEGEADVRLEIVAGMVPRFSVQACVVNVDGQLVLFVDRILADSRPLSSYRLIVASCFAPVVMWGELDRPPLNAARFVRLRASIDWPRALRACEQFALAMLLPASAVLAVAEAAYSELVQQLGWVEIDEAARAIRNRLADHFAVPPALVHRRLVGWPCHLYGRIAQALAAEEPTLPPIDWLATENLQRQRMLFDIGLRQPVRA